MKTYDIRPNAQRPDWPKRKDFTGSSAKEDFERAIEEVQRKVPYYGHPYDDNVDWREMVWDIIEANQGEKTFCWTEPSGFNQSVNPITVTPLLRYQERDALGYRYVYVTWELK